MDEKEINLPVLYEHCDTKTRKLVREQYAKLQNNCCWYCNALLSDKPSSEIMKLYIDRSLFPKNFFKWPIHLHHDHDTGLTIGAVHNRCNAILWQYHGQ